MEQTILVICVSVLVFFVCRELVCWYFKINERNKLLKDILKALDDN